MHKITTENDEANELTRMSNASDKVFFFFVVRFGGKRWRDLKGGKCGMRDFGCSKKILFFAFNHILGIRHATLLTTTYYTRAYFNFLLFPHSTSLSQTLSHTKTKTERQRVRRNKTRRNDLVVVCWGFY